MVEFTEACARYMASWCCTDTCAPWLPPSALSPVFTATHSRLRAVRLPAKPQNIPNSAISSFDRMQMPYGNKHTAVFSKRENNSVRDWESGFEPGEKEIKRSTGLLVALTVSCSGHQTVSSFLWKKAQLENVEVKKLASIWLSTKNGGRIKVCLSAAHADSTGCKRMENVLFIAAAQNRKSCWQWTWAEQMEYILYIFRYLIKVVVGHVESENSPVASNLNNCSSLCFFLMHHVFQKGEDLPQGSGPGEALVKSREKQSVGRWMLVPILKITETKKTCETAFLIDDGCFSIKTDSTRATQSYHYEASSLS